MLDDIGFGVTETFGGDVHTPTLTRLAREGISYNTFHTTSICSPTRTAILTGRNHTRAGSGTIAERAVAFLTENYDHIEPPRDDPKYHLTVDLADHALQWLDDHQAFSPDKPFFMYWVPGGVHALQHIFSEWADKYKRKFDDGWDAYRERVYRRQLEQGIIPAGTKLTPRDPSMASWESIPASQRAF